jgi:hypothetical protein
MLRTARSLRLLVAGQHHEVVLGRGDALEQRDGVAGLRVVARPKASTAWMRPPRARSESAPSRAAAIIFLGVRCE